MAKIVAKHAIAEGFLVLKKKKQSPYKLLQLKNDEIQSANNELQIVNQQQHVSNQSLDSSNQSLDISNKSLRRINNDLNNFVYSTSHDLISPIVNIEALVTMLVK